MKETRRTRTLIAVDAVKDAALYAEWVVPVGIALHPGSAELPPTQVLFDKLLPVEVKQNREYMSLLGRLIDKPPSVSEDPRTRSPYFRLGVLSQTLYSQGKGSYAFLTMPRDKKHAELGPDPFITTMLRLDLIDTSKLRWCDVLAVRDDPQAHGRLRRLRLLFEEDYAGRSLSYIEDNINRRIEDYHSVIKDWRFETCTGILEQLISSKAFPSLFAGSVAALVLGSPVVAAGVMAGVSLELGKATLQYAKRRHRLNKMLRELPIGYLVAVQRRAEQHKNV
jgi:hypothetical protein